MKLRSHDESSAKTAGEQLLPEGWKATPLYEVTECVPNINPKSTPNRKFSYIDISAIDNKKFEINPSEIKHFLGQDAPSRARRPIQSGDVLFSNVRTHLRNIALLRDNIQAEICSTGFTVLRATCAVDPNLLHLWVLSDAFINSVTPQQTGSHYPATSDSAVLAQSILLPPLAEQKRIVEKVESLLAQVNSAKDRLARVPLILKRFRQAVLAAACSGRLTEEWRENESDLESAEELIQRITSIRKARHEEATRATREAGHSRPRPFDNLEPRLRTDLELQELPAQWTWVDLRFLMHEKEPFCYGVVQPGEDAASGIPLIRSGDLHTLPSLDGLRRIPQGVDAQYRRSRVQGGEILVTVVGANIGTVAIAPMEARGFNIARAVAKVPVRDFDARYILLWLKTSTALAWMTGDAREVARPTLNLEQLQTLPVPLPPLEEQREIVRRTDALLDLADRTERRITAALARAERLPQTILSKAFSGELVPTEAELARTKGRDFESAEALLERIQREREEAASPTKSQAGTRQRRGRQPARTAG